MIIVTGANGQLGRAVAERLLARVPAERIGVSVRDPEKARELEERGVRVRRGDLDDAAGLAHAVEGASRVLIVSVDKGGRDDLCCRTVLAKPKDRGKQRSVAPMVAVS